MKKNYRVSLEEFKNYFLAYYDTIKQEVTIYSLMKYMSKRGCHISWVTCRHYLQELEHMGIVKRRMFLNRKLYLPVGETMIF